MLKHLPLFVGLRYIRSKRRNGFVSFVSGFSFGAMALGVMALIVVLSVMNGFASEIHSRVLNVLPHLTIKNERGIEQWSELSDVVTTQKEVQAAAPYVEGYGMLRLGGAVQGVSIQGVLPEQEAGVTQIANHMVVGEFELLQPGEFGIVIGSVTARALGVVAGDELQVTLPEVSRTLAGIYPREKRLTVVGVFQVGAQVDSGLAFVHLNDAQKLYRRGNFVDGLRLRISNPLFAELIGAQLSFQDDEYTVESWGDQLGSLFSAMKMEKIVVGLLLTIVVAVAAFNIVANLVLMVSEKRKDIAVLRSMGARPETVMGIFIVQGTFVGALGILVGCILGCLLGIWIGDLVVFFEKLFGREVFDPTVYFVSSLPSQLQLNDVFIVCCGALLMSLLATIYPAWRASRVEPAEALRYDH